MPEREPPEQREPPDHAPPPPESPPDTPANSESSELVNVEDDEVRLEPRIWSIVTHLSLFVLPVLGPLLVLGLQNHILGRRSALVTFHGKQAVIWQIAAIIVGVATLGIGTVIMTVISLYVATKAGQGEYYAYPLIGDYASQTL